MITNPIWVEKYRPRTLEDAILPVEIKNIAKGIIETGVVPHMILSGPPGCGKTTLAKIIAETIEADYLFINSSTHGGIDTIRTDVTKFASSMSFNGKRRITILDEADGLTRAAQDSLRGCIEQFSSNNTFIFTCNFVQKIIDPLQSRGPVIEFKIKKEEKPKLMAQFFKMVVRILTEENIEFDKAVIVELVDKTFPDYRKCLSILQQYASTGKIDSGILSKFSTEHFDELVTALKSSKFNDVRKWVANNNDLSPEIFFRMFYDKIGDKVEKKSLPATILLLGEYSYRSSLVADREINYMAFLTEVMLSNDVVWL